MASRMREANSPSAARARAGGASSGMFRTDPAAGTARPPAVSYELVVCIAKDLREPSPQTPRTTKEAPPTNSFMNVTHTHVHISHALDHRHSQHGHR